MGLTLCCCNPCNVTWPKVLTCKFTVGQSQSSFYFNNFPVPGYPTPDPEPLYTLTYGPRPSDVPNPMELIYFNNPGGVFPPYYVTMPDNAWWSDLIPVICFSQPANMRFYLWFKGCTASVMVINIPYSILSDGTLVTQGAGNNIHNYVVTQAGDSTHPFQMRRNVFYFEVEVSGTHGSDDVTPDAQGGAGGPSAVRHGP